MKLTFFFKPVCGSKMYSERQCFEVFALCFLLRCQQLLSQSSCLARLFLCGPLPRENRQIVGDFFIFVCVRVGVSGLLASSAPVWDIWARKETQGAHLMLFLGSLGFKLVYLLSIFWNFLVLVIYKNIFSLMNGRNQE